MVTQQKRAAIYGRSTAPGHVPGESDVAGAAQIAEAKAYCQEHGYRVSEQHIYHEVFAGTDYKNRPAFTRLRDAAKHKEFDVVVVLAYDRIARKERLIGAAIAALEKCGVSVESVREEFPFLPVMQLAKYIRSAVRDIARSRQPPDWTGQEH